MILFFYGDNQYAARAKLRQTIERYKAKNTDIGLERIDGATVEASQLLQNLATLPFLASSRLVVVEDLSQNKVASAKVLEALDNIPDSTNVVFYERSPDKRTVFYKTMLKQARVVEFKQLAPPKLQSWVVAKVAELGGQISPQTAAYLVEQVGTDQWQLEQELQKLVNYQAEITNTIIEKLVETKFSSSVFDMVDAIASGDAGRAVELYGGLRQSGEDAYKIMGMVGWQLHNLAMVVAAGSVPPAELARKAGMAPFVAQKSRQVARGLTVEDARQMYRLLTQVDTQLKSTSVDPDVLLEQLIVNLSGIHQKTKN